MKVLALDLSSKCGWALFKDTKLVKYGKVSAAAPVLSPNDTTYPWKLVDTIDKLAWSIVDCVNANTPDFVIIEQRTTQRFLEWLHWAVLDGFGALPWLDKNNVYYINSSDWRKAVQMKMSSEDKKNNRLVNKINKLPKALRNKMKKEKGVKGKVTLKHLSVRMVKDKFGIELQQGQNDEADAILLGAAYYEKAPRVGHY